MKTHKRLSLTVLLIVSLLLSVVTARQPASDADPIDQASRIAGSILVNGHSMDYLRSLTDFGGRLTGTRAYQRSAEWAAEQFRAAGIKNVKLEPWTIPNGSDSPGT